MVTKGIIKTIDYSGNTCTVRVPFFETANNDEIVSTATVSNTPGSYNGYKVGDVVWVAFENGSMDHPVVIGKLYLGVENEKADPRGALNVVDSSISNSAEIPFNTKLNANLAENVANTNVPFSSLEQVANSLSTAEVNIAQNDRDYGNRFKQVFSDTDNLKTEIEQTANAITLEVEARESAIAGVTTSYESAIEQTATSINARVDTKVDSKNDGWDEHDENGDPITEDADGNKLTRRGLGWDLTKDSWAIKAYDQNENGTLPEDGLDLFKIDRTTVAINVPNLQLSGYPRVTVVRYAYGTNSVHPALYKTDCSKTDHWKTGNDPTTLEVEDSQHKYHKPSLDETCINLVDNGKEGWTQTELSYNPDDSNTPYVWQWTQTAKYEYHTTTESWEETIVDKVVKLAINENLNTVHKNISSLNTSVGSLNSTAVLLGDKITTLEGLQNETSGNITLLDSNVNHTLALTQGKTTTYYGSTNPASIGVATYSARDTSNNPVTVVKQGDCWFCTGETEYKYVKVDPVPSDEDSYVGKYVSPNNEDAPYLLVTEDNLAAFTNGTSNIKITVGETNAFELEQGDATSFIGGILYQWVGNPSTDEYPGHWEDIGAELVANKLTANYINALDITAKKVTIVDKNNTSILFTADGLAVDNEGKPAPYVKIANFNVAESSIYSNSATLEGSAGGVYIGADGISIGTGFKVEAGGDAGDTKVTMSDKVLTSLSAVTYWLSSTCTVHTGSKHGQSIIVTAMKKIGNTEESQDNGDNGAYLWWRYKNATEGDGTPSAWALATAKHRINFTFPDEVPDDDILVIATHDSSFDPNAAGIDLSTDSHIYEREEIPFSPLNTPILNLTNDSASLTYDGNNKIGSDTVSSTAELWFNGVKVTSGVTYTWDLVNCTDKDDKTGTNAVTGTKVEIKTLSANTATATCKASYGEESLTKVFTITKQLKGEPGDPSTEPGPPGRSVVSTIKYYKLMTGTPSDITSSYTAENPPTGWKTSPDAFNRDTDTGKNYWETVRTKYDNNTYSWSTPVQSSMLTVDFINSLGITAEKIDVTKGTNPIFTADAVTEAVSIGGFKVTSNSITSGDKTDKTLDGGANRSGVYIGTDGISIGSGFKVTANGESYISNVQLTDEQKTELKGEKGDPSTVAGPAGRSVVSTTKYYKLATSLPSAPTSKDPTDWSTSPPAFTTGNDYYESVRTVYNTSVGGKDFEWSTPVKNSMLTVEFINALGITAENLEVPGKFKASKSNDTVEIGGFRVTGDTLSSDQMSISPTLLEFSDSAMLDFSGNLTFINNDTTATYMLTSGAKDFIMKNNGGAGIRFTKAPEMQEITSTPITLSAVSTTDIQNPMFSHIYIRYSISSDAELLHDVPVTVWVCYINGAGEATRAKFTAIIPKTKTLDPYYDFNTGQTVTGAKNTSGRVQVGSFMAFGSDPEWGRCNGISFSYDENYDPNLSTPLDGDHKGGYTTKYITYQAPPYSNNNNILYSLGSFCPNDTASDTDGSIVGYTLGDDDHVWAGGKFLTSPIIGSDYRLKNNITELSAEYETVFDSLKPKSFKYNNGESGRTHLGFIAQDVEASIMSAGLTTTDFAGICIGKDKNATYALRYEEFIPLNTAQIQKLKKRVSDQEARITQLEEIIKNLKTE